jgi:hypothetical protein
LLHDPAALVHDSLLRCAIARIAAHPFCSACTRLFPTLPVCAVRFHLNAHEISSAGAAFDH